MPDFITNYEFISMIAIFTYWGPMLICASVYLFRIIGMYRDDLEKCEDDSYRPDLTVGLILWCIGCTVIPVINLFAVVFDCASSVFKWLGKTFDMPLVRKRSSAK